MANEITTNLKPGARKVALRAIEDVHLAYYEKGGIRDTAQQLEGQLEGAAKVVFNLAVYASKQAPELPDAMRLFLDMCEYAEGQYKVQHEVENLRDALPTWAQYKTNVLRGMRLGLNPGEHKTEKVFRSKTMELISRSRNVLDSPDATQREGPGPEPAMRTEEEIKDFVESTVIPDTLKQLVEQVVFAVEIIRPARVPQAEEILREAWQKLDSLVDRRRLKSGG
jgi:hypothetical protein